MLLDSQKGIKAPLRKLDNCLGSLIATETLRTNGMMFLIYHFGINVSISKAHASNLQCHSFPLSISDLVSPFLFIRQLSFCLLLFLACRIVSSLCFPLLSNHGAFRNPQIHGNIPHLTIQLAKLLSLCRFPVCGLTLTLFFFHLLFSLSLPFPCFVQLFFWYLQ